MAKATDFNPEQNIQLKLNLKKRGVVIGNRLSDGDEVVAVEWEDGTLQKVNANDIQVCLSAEEEFKLFVDEVNSKLAAASALIREANSLAAQRGKDLQSIDNEGDDPSYDSLFDTYQLERAMSDSGWNTSSWHC